MNRSIAAAVIVSLALTCIAAAAPLKGEDPGQHRKIANELTKFSKVPNLWEGSWQLETGLYHFPGPVEYTAEAAEYVKQYKPKADSPMANCLMPGMPFVMNQGAMPIKFFIAPGMIGLYVETYAVTRFLHLDGRAVDEDPNPTFLGTSVAHWEGDTLVVDTRGFVADTLLQIGELPGGRAGFGIPIFKDHGPNLRFVERVRLPDYKTMEITTTIYDDTIFAKPYTSTRVWHRHTSRNADPQEWVCSDNRDRYDEKTDTLHYNYQGGAGAKLTEPDPGSSTR